MRKIASHYYLRSNNTIGKFPVITFDEKGCITEIRERDSFSEEPFMEHVNGLLVPKFTSTVSNQFFQLDIQEQLKQLKIFSIKGNKLIVCSLQYEAQLKNLIKKVPSLSSIFIQEECVDSFGFDKMSMSDSVVGFYQSQQNNFMSQGYGSLKVGTTPGILALSGIGTEPFKWNEKSKLKIII